MIININLVKKIGLLFALLIAFSYVSLASYIEKFPITVKQPDGTEVHCFVTGDEFYNWVHDENGFSLIRHPLTGIVEYAKLVNDELVPSGYQVGTVDPFTLDLQPWLIISAEKRQQLRQEFLKNTPENPAKKEKNVGSRGGHNNGTINNIVIYIRFAGESEFPAKANSYNDMFNRDEANYSSMLGYFKAVSNGNTFIHTTFYPESTGNIILSYQDINPRSYFEPYHPTTNTNGYNSDTEGAQRLHQMLRRAIVAVSVQVPVTLDLDFNNDGFVDNICFIVRGNPGAWADYLWPHRWSLYYSTPSVYINGKRVWDYNLQMETHLDNNKASVLAHEMFHTLGAPDLYRYEYNGTPVGTWDLMATNVTPPQSSTAWMKYKYGGWIDNIPEITQTGTYTLNNIWSPTNNAYKIASPNSSTEFFVVEYRDKTVYWDSNIPGSGLIISRIDTRLFLEGNAEGPPDEVYIYRPGGNSNMANDGNIYSAHFSSNVGRTVFNDTSNPYCFLSNNQLGGINISEISTSGGTTMSFKVTIGDFIPVDNLILNTPTAYIGTPLTLSATVLPSDATYKNIVWSVQDAGTTGATITDEITFNATAVGTAIVRATIIDGTTGKGNYTQDFEINVLQKSSTTREGDYRNIVIFISFWENTITLSKDPVDTVFNGKRAGTSLFSYYRDISGDKFHILSDFFPAPSGQTILSYQASRDREDYILSTDELEGKLREKELLIEALTSAKNDIETKFTAAELDYNNDGMVDLVTFVVQGAPTPSQIFYILNPHASFLGGFSLHGKTVGSYTLVMELGLDRSVLVHETYHTLGAPDLYCYNKPPSGITPVGYWDVMAGATVFPQSSLTYITNRDGNFIPDIPEISKTGTYTLYDSWNRKGDTVAYKIISPISQLSNPPNQAEYFVLEYRRKCSGTVYESANPNEGIIISRINPKVGGNGNSNGTTKPFGVYVYRENGTYFSEGNLKNACFKSDGLKVFSDESNPRAFLSDNRLGLGGIVISDFSDADCNEFMTFRVTFPESEIWEIGKGDSTRVVAWYSDGKLFIKTSIENDNWDMKDWATPDGVEPPWYQDYRDLIKEVVIYTGVTNIGNYAFYRCTNLKTINNIPLGVTYIGDHAFTSCSSLQTIKLPNGVLSIGEHAFRSCTGLSNITVPNSVTTIDEHAFNGCTSLKAFIIPTGITTIKQFTFAYSGLLSIIIPCNVIWIENDAFDGCTALKEVRICSSVQKFGTEKTSLVFGFCTGLTDIWVEWETCPPKIVEKVFENLDLPNINLHIPCPYYYHYKSTDTCQSALVWQDFNLVGDPQLITVTADPSGYGTVTGGGNHTCGKEITVKATPTQSWYKFVNWTENGVVVSNNADYKFRVTKPRTLVANFVAENYKITLLMNPAGTGSTVTGAGSYAYDTELEVSTTFDPECYTFDGWTENGVIVSPNPDYFFFVKEPRTLTANFKPIPYSIFAIVSPGGGGTVVGDGTHGCGNEITLTAIPTEPDYVFVSWTENNSIVSNNADYKFTVTGPRILTANFALKSYLIELFSNPTEGSITLGGGTYTHWDMASVDVSLSECYEFVRWTDEFGVEVSNITPYDFTVTGARKLIADLRLKSCDIAVVAEPAEGGTAIGGNNYTCGTPVMVVASAKPMYEFTHWSLNNDTVSKNLFYQFNVSDKHCPSTLVAHFEIFKYKVITNANPIEGTTTGNGSYEYGEEVSIEAFPTNCYSFVNWTDSNGAEISTDNPFTFFIDKDTILTANFAIIEYEVTTQSNPLGGTTTGDGFYNCGDDITLTATLDECYTFTNWTTTTGEVVTTDNPYTFTVSNDCDLVANFLINTYTVSASINPSEGGTVDGTGTYNCGEMATLTATPLGCYGFVNWTDNNGTEISTDNPFTFFIDKDTILTANFAIIEYEVTTQSNPLGGTTTGDGFYDCGDIITITATLDECYTFTNWTTTTGDVVSAENPYTFTVSNDYDLVANFLMITYTVSATIDPNEGGTVDGVGTYNCGEMATLTATPLGCYGFVNWTSTTGEEITTDNPYSFTVYENISLVANFEIVTTNEYEVTTFANPIEGTTTGDGIYNCDAPVTVEAIPTSCYNFVNWTENGIPVCTTAVYHFNIKTERNLVANFESIKFNVVASAEPPEGGTVSYNNYYDCGTTITVKAIPNPKWVFTYWTVNGIIIPTADENYSFTITGNHVLVAHFEPETYTIITKPNPVEGGFAKGTGYNIEEGTEWKIWAEPFENYEFVNWTYEDGSLFSTNITTFFEVTESLTLYANFVLKTYKITVLPEPQEGGVVYTDNGKLFQYYQHGTEATVTAEPNSTYRFVKWVDANTDSVLSYLEVYTFPVTKSRNMLAIFELKTYCITLLPSPVGAGQVFGGGCNHPFGEIITVWAEANQEWEFVEWTKDGIPVCEYPQYTFNVVGPDTLVAHFKHKVFNIIVSQNPSNGGTVWEDKFNIPYGTLDTLHARALPNYVFVNWTEEEYPEFSFEEEDYPFVVTRSRNLVANFELETYNITVLAEPPFGGEVWENMYDIPYGTDTAVYATANQHFIFMYWTLDNGTLPVGSDWRHPFSAVKSCTYIAHFKAEIYSITLSANPPEGGTVEGAGNYGYGTEITVTAMPEPGFEFAYWTEDEEVVSTSADYTFTVTKSCHLVAHFKSETLHIVLKKNPNDGGMVEFVGLGGYNIPYADTRTIKATPLSNYEFVNWTRADSTVFSTNALQSFSVLQSDTLTANFILKGFNVILSADPTTGGTVWENHDNVPYGEVITVHASPNEDYNFLYWTEFGSDYVISNQLDLEISILQSLHLVAHFELKTFGITLLADPPYGGEVWSVPEGNNFPWGTPLTAYAEANTNFTFVRWANEDGSTATLFPTYSFNVTSSRTLTAYFKTVSYPVTLSVTPTNPVGGTVEGAGVYDFGMTVTITATPDECYNFEGWYENGEWVSDNNPYSFVIDGPHHFTAHFEQKMLEIITASNPEPGGWTTGGDEEIPCGEERMIEAFANIGYIFEYWTINQTIVTNNPYSFEVTEDIEAVAHFTDMAHSITLEPSPFIGGLVWANGTYPHGEMLTVHAKANLGHQFLYWTENDEWVHGDTTYTFMVDHSRHLVAHFDSATYIVTTKPNIQYGGTTTPQDTTLAYQAMLTIEAIANDNFVFKHWMENNVPIPASGATYKFPVTRNRDLVAVFEPIKCNITLDKNPPNGGEVGGGGYNLTYGSVTNIWAEPSDKYYFVNWTDEDGDIFSDDAHHTFIVTKSLALTANFTTSVAYQINLSANPTQGGTVEGGGEIPLNKEITVSATADDCYTFVNWTEGDDVVSTNLDYTFVVNRDRDLVANFLRNNYAVNVLSNIPEFGSVAGGGENILCGEVITVIATPYLGYLFVNWTIDGVEVSTDSVYTFTVMESCMLVANFIENLLTITLQANPPNFGTVATSGTVLCGSDFTASATPFISYSFINWTENGVVVSTDPDYTFTVTQSRTLVANFEKTLYFVKVEVNDTIYGTACCSGFYNLDEIAEVTAFAKKGYRFRDWTVNGNIKSKLPQYDFPVVENITLTANFYGLDFDEYAATLWDNTFMLNLKKLAAEEYEVVGCKWYKNGKLLTNTNAIDDYSYSAGPRAKDLLELAPTFYTFEVILKNGSVMFSTKKILTEYLISHETPKNNLLIYPNPTISGNSFTVENVTEGTQIFVYNQMGICVKTILATGSSTTLVLDAPSGAYLIRNENKEGKLIIIK